MKLRILLFAAAVLFPALLPSSAFAQFACGAGPGPGQRAVGVTQGGNGIAPSTMCVNEDDYEDNARGPSQHSPPGPDLSELFAGMAAANKKLADDFNALTNDPEYRKYRQGFWKFYQEGVPPRPGKGCSAIFASMQGMLSLASAADPGQPVVYSFSGLDVPKPKTSTQVNVTFHQSSGQDITMPVMNLTMPYADIGTIAVMLKDMPSALRNIQDSEDLAIDLDGKRIYTLTYHDGKKMKAEVEKCMAGRG